MCDFLQYFDNIDGAAGSGVPPVHPVNINSDDTDIDTDDEDDAVGSLLRKKETDRLSWN